MCIYLPVLGFETVVLWQDRPQTCLSLGLGLIILVLVLTFWSCFRYWYLLGSSAALSVDRGVHVSEVFRQMCNWALRSWSIHCMSSVYNVQRCWAGTRRRQRSVGTTYVSPATHTEAGAIHAGAAVSTGRHAQDDGQRRHVLRTSCSLHLHL